MDVTPVDVESLRRRVSEIRWWHSIDLGHGVVTQGPWPDYPRGKLSFLGLPDRMDGMSVLDVGAWDGFFSFEAERRGASRVVAADWVSWNGQTWGTKAGFDLARATLKSRVEDKMIDVYDLTPQNVGTFDLVIFLDVLYHLKHPLLALERLFSVTRGQLILQTHVDLCLTRYPAMRFYPGKELANDPTNWWGPNPSAVESMLKVVGFKKVERVPTPGRFHRLRKLARAARQPTVSRFVEQLQQDRLVFHAWT
jgi:tRNA (mo5U34)-methyltransferase